MPHRPAEDEEDFEEVPDEFDENTFPVTPREPTTSANTKRVVIQKETRGAKTIRYLENKQRRLQTLAEEVQSKRMQGCTFHPKTNKSKKKLPTKRTLDQFLKSQNQHLLKTSANRSALKDRIEQENRATSPFSPCINRSPLKAKMSGKEKAFERLYGLRDKPKRVGAYEHYDHMPTISPKSNRMVRDKPVEELLYLDAMRRVEKRTEPNEEWGEGTLRFKSSQQEKYAGQKLLRDYTEAAERLGLIEEGIEGVEGLLGLLLEMGYVREPISDNDWQLTRQAWGWLSDTEDRVELGLLAAWLLAVSGIYGMQIARSDGRTFSIDQSIGQKIHDCFDSFYRNRLQQHSRVPTDPSFYEQYNSYSPYTNPDSAYLAHKHRNKMVSKTNEIFASNGIDITLPESGLSHQDMLVMCNVAERLRHQVQKIEKDGRLDEECTFQPNAWKEGTPGSKSRRRMGDKCRELYEEAREKHKAKKIQNAKEQDRHFEGVIIKPLTPRRKTACQGGHKAKGKSVWEVKDVEKALARMAVGRDFASRKSQEETGAQMCIREVLMSVDVQIELGSKRLYVYKDDVGRLEQVVGDFGRECKLDLEAQAKLLDRLNKVIPELPQ